MKNLFFTNLMLGSLYIDSIVVYTFIGFIGIFLYGLIKVLLRGWIVIAKQVSYTLKNSGWLPIGFSILAYAFTFSTPYHIAFILIYMGLVMRFMKFFTHRAKDLQKRHLEELRSNSKFFN